MKCARLHDRHGGLAVSPVRAVLPGNASRSCMRDAQEDGTYVARENAGRTHAFRLTASPLWRTPPRPARRAARGLLAHREDHLVCRLLLEKKKKKKPRIAIIKHCSSSDDG